MNVKVLGPGCAKCKKLFTEVEKAVVAAGLPVVVEKVEKIADMLDLGVTVTPALVIDGQLQCAGRVPPVAELVTMLTNSVAKNG